VPKSIIANQLNLLYICSDNLSFWGAYLQNGCIAVISSFGARLKTIGWDS